MAASGNPASGRLIECGVQPGDNVAITMSKGAGQLVAVLAVLLAGAVYASRLLSISELIQETVKVHVKPFAGGLKTMVAIVARPKARKMAAMGR